MSEIETANHRLVQELGFRAVQHGLKHEGKKSPSAAALSDDGRHFPFQLIWPARGLIKLNPIGSTRILLALTALSVYSRIQTFQHNEGSFRKGAH